MISLYNSGVANQNSTLIQDYLTKLEKEANKFPMSAGFNPSDILHCVKEIKVSLKNGVNPRYSVRMLLKHCVRIPDLYDLAIRTFSLI